jgi:hypothetical protein
MREYKTIQPGQPQISMAELYQLIGQQRMEMFLAQRTISAQQERIAALEKTVTELTERLEPNG